MGWRTFPAMVWSCLGWTWRARGESDEHKVRLRDAEVQGSWGCELGVEKCGLADSSDQLCSPASIDLSHFAFEELKLW